MMFKKSSIISSLLLVLASCMSTKHAEKGIISVGPTSRSMPQIGYSADYDYLKNMCVLIKFDAKSKDDEIVLNIGGSASAVPVFRDKNDNVYLLTAGHINIPINDIVEKKYTPVLSLFLNDGVGPITHISPISMPFEVVFGELQEKGEPGIDFCVIRVRDKDRKLKVTKIDNYSTLPSLGSTVYISSAPIGNLGCVTKGSIVRYTVNNKCLLITSSAEVMPGSSGGGLFNSKLELIGISVRGFPIGMSMSVSLCDIKEELKKYNLDFILQNSR
jgi:hypothetical protein